MSSPSEILTAELAPARKTLLEHPIHSAIDALPRLRAFMAVHVFAVWDFMALVKRLQRELTCTTVPWLPPADAELARFVNEIVRDEESDVDPDGNACSHFELYRRAMTEVGADDAAIATFIDALRRGATAADALTTAAVAPPIREFVQSTLTIAEHGSPLEVAAGFLHGREDLIPAMFRAFRSAAPGGIEARCFRHYLERHIELDGDHHSVLAARLVDAFWRNAEPTMRDRAIATARRAIAARQGLWDHALATLQVTAGAATADAATAGAATAAATTAAVAPSALHRPNPSDPDGRGPTDPAQNRRGPGNALLTRP